MLLAADHTVIFNDKTQGEATKRDDDDLFLCESIATAPVDQRVTNDEPTMLTPASRLRTLQTDSINKTDYTLPHKKERPPALRTSKNHPNNIDISLDSRQLHASIVRGYCADDLILKKMRHRIKRNQQSVQMQLRNKLASTVCETPKIKGCPASLLREQDYLIKVCKNEDSLMDNDDTLAATSSLANSFKSKSVNPALRGRIKSMADMG